MGIYIKGFKMPEGGYRTIEIAYDADGHPMAITDGGDVFDVIPVPAHGRLIDVDAVLSESGPYEYEEWCKWALDCYMDAPTIIPAEIISENEIKIIDTKGKPNYDPKRRFVIPAEEDADIQKEFMQNWHEEDSE